MKRSQVIIVLALVILLIISPMQGIGDGITSFSDGSNERTISFQMAGVDKATGINLPADATVLKAVMEVTGEAVDFDGQVSYNTTKDFNGSIFNDSLVASNGQLGLASNGSSVTHGLQELVNYTLDNVVEDGDLVLETLTGNWTQTNWSGGPGQASWSDPARYDTAIDINTIAFGEDVGLERNINWTRRQNATDAKHQMRSTWDPVLERMLVFGGRDFSGSPYKDEFWAYEPENDIWAQLPSGPSSREKHSMVFDEVRDWVLMFGGLNASGRKGDLWAFNVSNDTWFQLADLPGGEVRETHCAAWEPVDDGMFIYGGRDSTGDTNELWVYYPGNDTWFQRASGATPRSYPLCGWDTAGDQLVIWGGNSGGTLYNQTYVYGRTTNSWVQKSDGARGKLQATSAWDSTNGRLLVHGGVNGTVANDLWAYDPVADSWSMLPNGSTNMSQHTMSWDTSHGQLIVLAGSTMAGLDNETWTYGPDYRTTGILQSSVYDAGKKVHWTDIEWSGQERIGPSQVIDVKVRTGPTPVPDTNWSSWSVSYKSKGIKIVEPDNRYIQYKLTLTTQIDVSTPLFENIRINYTWITDNGTLDGPSIDLGLVPSVFTHFSLDGTLQVDTNWSAQISTSADNLTWSSWEDLDVPDSNIGLQPERYVRWKVILFTDEPTATPALDQVLFRYGHLNTTGNSTYVAVEATLNITEVTVDMVVNLNGQALDISVSNDGGTTWTLVNPSLKHVFQTNGSTLRIGLTFMGTTSVGPVLDVLDISYRMTSPPMDPSLDIGDDGFFDWNWTGPFLGTQVVPDFADEINLYFVAHPDEVDANGNITVPINVSSSSACKMMLKNLQIEYEFPPTDNPPDIEPIPDPTIEVNDPWTLQVKATDMDGDPLTFSLVKGPPGLTLHPTKGLITWTPTTTGSYDVEVMVTDRKYNTMVDFTIIVIPHINRAPKLDAKKPPAEGKTGQEYTYKFKATDVENDTLKFRLVSGPKGMTIDETTGKLKWTPKNSQLGIQDFTVAVSDGLLESNETYVVTVKKGPEVIQEFDGMLFLLLLLIIVIIGCVAGVAMYMSRKRKKTREMFYQQAPAPVQPEGATQPTTVAGEQAPYQEYKEPAQEAQAPPSDQPVQEPVQEPQEPTQEAQPTEESVPEPVQETYEPDQNVEQTEEAAPEQEPVEEGTTEESDAPPTEAEETPKEDTEEDDLDDILRKLNE